MVLYRGNSPRFTRNDKSCVNKDYQTLIFSKLAGFTELKTVIVRWLSKLIICTKKNKKFTFYFIIFVKYTKIDILYCLFP